MSKELKTEGNIFRKNPNLKPKGTIKIKLIGGIGNQLFIYFAGRYIADKSNKKLLVDLSQLNNFGTSHIGDIRSLSLPGTFTSPVVINNRIIGIAHRINSKMCREFNGYRKVQLAVFGRFYATDLGFEKELEESTSVSHLFGYFQTWRYFENYHSSISDLFELKTATNWFANLSRIAKIEKPIGVHLRRGDYSHLHEEFGLLSQTYYLQALKLLEESHPNNELWVFSDDIDQARAMFANLGQRIVRFIEPPDTSEPIESLLLMGKCDALVIANSTFSYWSGILGPKDRKVIAPEKWFRARTDPRDLLPLNWTKIESHWVEFEPTNK